jgi:hypothetical protein
MIEQDCEHVPYGESPTNYPTSPWYDPCAKEVLRGRDISGWAATIFGEQTTPPVFGAQSRRSAASTFRMWTQPLITASRDQDAISKTGSVRCHFRYVSLVLGLVTTSGDPGHPRGVRFSSCRGVAPISCCNLVPFAGQRMARMAAHGAVPNAVGYDLPAQTVDATPSNQLIRHYFPVENRFVRLNSTKP